MNTRKWFAFTLVVILVAAAVVTHPFDRATSQSVVGKDELVMITSPDYPPYEFYDTSQGDRKIVGFDIDIANTLARELGFKLKIEESDFNGLIPALQSGRADFVMAGMTPTPERKQNVDFSIIYYDAKDTIIALQGSNLKQPTDLKGKQVGVQLGTIQEQNAQAIAKKVPGITLKQLNKVPDIIQEIQAKRIDAAIVEDTVAKGFIQANPDLEYSVITSEEQSGSAIAFPKNSNLVTPFNQVLTQMKGDKELEALAKKWFSINATAADQAPEAAPPKGGLNINFGRLSLDDYLFILKGIPTTLLFTLISVFFGLIAATGLSLLKISRFKPLQWFANAYTSIFRGTPLLLQLSLIYYAIPQLVGFDITPLQAGVTTFTLNSGAYMSETIRAGIQAVDKGQHEASMSLGVPYTAMMKDIILPQALKNILPALVNETISLLKDSSLVSTVGVVETLRASQIVGANKYIYFEPLLTAGVLYYLMVMGLTAAASVLERRLKRSD
ncbi:MAG: ABC transporter substrate-binding protein/permease [Thermosynechococcaceae cyanobacterium]